ncbi:uncharacterized protein [Mytilus edulis]|uniref:uncharacterized protein isoform X2 n=1 Tax=Mytilus edulis TaxID=6550 RepID=UPI0039F0F7B2
MTVRYLFLNYRDFVSWGTKLQTTNHISGWIPMRSQDNNLSYHVWKHNLNDLPVRVDVQVKPQTGSDTDYVFPGIAAAQRDDSMTLPYGGIVYKYNKNSVMLYAPNKHSGKPSGHAIYTGGAVWNGPKQQTESNVLTRVRVWGEQHFPPPNFTTKWTQIKIREISPREINHNLGVQPEYVVLQIKLGSTEDVADGIGYMMAMESSSFGDKWGAVPYAYNEKNIRVWTRLLGGTLFTIPEGWGKTQETYKFGQYRILAWKSLGAKSHTVQKLNLPSSSTTELRFSTPINQNNDIVQVMVKELPDSSNQNAGYLFKATGAVQNTHKSSYGGVVYSYSNQSSRVWYPQVHANGKQYLVYIDKMFGPPTSTAILAELEITTFVPYDSPGLLTTTTTPMTSSTPTTTVSTIPSTKTSTTKTTSTQPTTTTPKATTSIYTTTPKHTTTSTLPTTTTLTPTSISTKTTTTASTTTSTLPTSTTPTATRISTKTTTTSVLTTTVKSNGVTNKQISSNTVKLCKLKFDYWVYILIGFGSCLVLVSIIWLSWYCLRSKDSKVTNIVEDKKRKTSVTKKEAWSLDFI